VVGECPADQVDRCSQAHKADQQHLEGEQVVLCPCRAEGGEDEVLVVAPVGDAVVVGDVERVLAWRQGLLDLAPQFLEVGQSGGPHPHDEVLVLRVKPLGGVAINCSLVFAPLVASPTYPELIDRDD